MLFIGERGFEARKLFKIVKPDMVTPSVALLHSNSADYLIHNIKHGIPEALRRNPLIYSPSRMDVERSLESQQSLAEVYQALINRDLQSLRVRKLERVTGRIYTYVLERKKRC